MGAHYLVGLGWIESLLIGAILAPTDPVFAAALVGNEKVPARLRHLLNVESGVNDGLALPFVMVLPGGRGRLGRPAPGGARPPNSRVGLAGRGAGAVVAIALERTRLFAASAAYGR